MTVSVSIGAGPAGATSAARRPRPTTMGRRISRDSRLTRAGSYVLLISGGGLPRRAINPITVTPGADQQAGGHGTATGGVTAGTGFGLTVQAEDPYGNPTPDLQRDPWRSPSRLPSGHHLWGE